MPTSFVTFNFSLCRYKLLRYCDCLFLRTRGTFAHDVFPISGEFCETNTGTLGRVATTDPCTASPCDNGGTCTATDAGSFLCTCPLGYTGPRCDVDIDDCAAAPCLHGSCVDAVSVQCLLRWKWIFVYHINNTHLRLLLSVCRSSYNIRIALNWRWRLPFKASPKSSFHNPELK